MDSLTRENPVRPVLVEWIDSVRDTGGWDSIEEYLRMDGSEHRARVQTCGFLIGTSKEFLLVSLSAEREVWRADAHAADAMLIPRRAVDSVVLLMPDNTPEAA